MDSVNINGARLQNPGAVQDDQPLSGSHLCRNVSLVSAGVVVGAASIALGGALGGLVVLGGGLASYSIYRVCASAVTVVAPKLSPEWLKNAVCKRVEVAAKQLGPDAKVENFGKVHVVPGDITRLKTDHGITVDAIVNAANSGLRGLSSGGVCKAIYNAAGAQQLDQEVNSNFDGCNVGSAVVTGSHDLYGSQGVQAIIHAVGPDCREDGFENLALARLSLKSAYKAALNEAMNQQPPLKSVAFPLLSVGIFKFPEEEGVKVAVEAVTEFQRDNKDAPEVYFVTYHEGNQANKYQKQGDRFRVLLSEQLTAYQADPAEAKVDALLSDFDDVTIVSGDITQLRSQFGIQVDGIVSATHTSLEPTRGVSGAIFAAAGQDALQKEVQAQYPKGGNVGEALITSAQKLNASEGVKSIIHAVVPDAGDAAYANPFRAKQALKQTYMAAFEQALNAKPAMKRLACPLLGTGQSGFSEADAVKVAVEAVKEFQAQHPDKLDVLFVTYDKGLQGDRLKTQLCRELEAHQAAHALVQNSPVNTPPVSTSTTPSQSGNTTPNSSNSTSRSVSPAPSLNVDQLRSVSPVPYQLGAADQDIKEVLDKYGVTLGRTPSHFFEDALVREPLAGSDMSWDAPGPKFYMVEGDCPMFLGRLKDGDIILKVDGKLQKDMDFTKFYLALNTGPSQAKVIVLRGDNLVEVSFKRGDLPMANQVDKPNFRKEDKTFVADSLVEHHTK